MVNVLAGETTTFVFAEEIEEAVGDVAAFSTLAGMI